MHRIIAMIAREIADDFTSMWRDGALGKLQAILTAIALLSLALLIGSLVESAATLHRQYN